MGSAPDLLFRAKMQTIEIQITVTAPGKQIPSTSSKAYKLI
jgi:hypothetical protein